MEKIPNKAQIEIIEMIATRTPFATGIRVNTVSIRIGISIITTILPG
jgi:hypothetical protein